MSLKNKYPISRKDFDAIKKSIRRYRIDHAQNQNLHQELNSESIITVSEEEDRISMKPEEKRLTKKEKLKILNELEGSGKSYSKDVIKDSWQVANREIWGDEVNECLA